jgi:hypothetical protein
MNWTAKDGLFQDSDFNPRRRLPVGHGVEAVSSALTNIQIYLKNVSWLKEKKILLSRPISLSRRMIRKYKN